MIPTERVFCAGWPRAALVANGKVRYLSRVLNPTPKELTAAGAPE